MLEAIRLWLNSQRQYLPGIILAGQFCKLPILDLLRKGESPRNRERLEKIMWDELNRLKEGRPQGIATAPPAPAKNIKLPNPEPVSKPVHIGSPIYDAAKLEADKMYRQVMADRAVLFNKASCEAYEDPNTPDRVKSRSKLALDVVEGYRKASALYEKADYIARTGSVPNTEETHEEDYAALPDIRLKPTISNIQKNLSKLRKREATPERLALIAAHEANLKKLEERWRSLNK
ncbi:MAG: hypothetical protein BGO53_08865 [Sphingobacteriales bacterium 39-19]|nr:hypothetical protein [Sphingobacteriales bacterium]OJW09925.1 MAG: hypothetical protein BGO53_08865 [Sphingobacteriales bacterium 39-19]